MLANLRLWRRQYGGSIRCHKKTVRLLLHIYCAIKVSFFIQKFLLAILRKKEEII